MRGSAVGKNEVLRLRHVHWIVEAIIHQPNFLIPREPLEMHHPIGCLIANELIPSRLVIGDSDVVMPQVVIDRELALGVIIGINPRHVRRSRKLAFEVHQSVHLAVDDEFRNQLLILPREIRIKPFEVVTQLDDQ